MLIGISGLAGSGKSTAAEMLRQKYGFVCVSFGDPLKRICRDVYSFSFDQMWGPSSARNAPDERYPREHGPYRDGSCACCGLKTSGYTLLEAIARGEQNPCYLTPRFALQQLGSEWGRVCYPNTWVDYTIKVAFMLNTEGGYVYDTGRGLDHAWRPGDENWKTSVVIPDVRFKNEVDAIKTAGGKLIRITRPNAGLSGSAGQHRSETEQTSIPDSEFDGVIVNGGTLAGLESVVTHVVGRWLEVG
jgi:hypothetical protein